MLLCSLLFCCVFVLDHFPKPFYNLRVNWDRGYGFPWHWFPRLEFRLTQFYFGGNQLFSDRTLTCCDCGNEFTFTVGEQEFYSSKGFSKDPRRCPECRRARKHDRENGESGRPNGAREMFEVVCADCGQTAKVPFRPRGDKPVYCAECFKNHGGGHK